MVNIISIPTKKLESQNAIFSMLYNEAEKIGMHASDLNLKSLLCENLDGFVVHFPDHFANNSSLPIATARSLGLLLSALIAKMRGAAIIWVAHNFGHLDIKHPVLTKIVLNRFQKMCDGIIFLSKYTKENFENTSTLKKCTYHLIYHPSYDHEKNFMPMIGKREFIKLGMIGKQDAYKDPERGLTWFKNSTHPNLKLKLAGKLNVNDHQLLEKFLTLDSNKSEIANTRLSDDELIQSIHDCDFALLPYKGIANSGMALLILSCGRPIITSDLPLFRELQDYFGKAWVRIVENDCIDTHLNNRPTDADCKQIILLLENISLKSIALNHLEFISVLHKNQ